MTDRRTLIGFAGAWAFLAVVASAKLVAVEVTVERSERGAIVRAEGELFAEYLTLSGHQPAVWPIVGPTGKRVTRSFPIGPLLATERDDHPHHHSLWFAHEDVNGYNFWKEPQPGLSHEQTPMIEHVDFVSLKSAGEQAILVTRNRWLSGKDQVVCEDQRTLVFGANENARWIDFSIKIIATNGPVKFGDIKDGTFSTRVAGTLKVDSGGRLVNSAGQESSQAWGMPAEWIDNSGLIDGEMLGLAMFSHPSNFQHPCRWHVRNYGLLCANPFGERQFPKSPIQQRGLEIDSGDSLSLRYRLYLHRGDAEHAQVAEVYGEYAAASIESLAGGEYLFQDDFESGRQRWVTTDREQPKSVWKVVSTDDGGANRAMRVTGTSSYRPPYRSPHSIALVKDVAVGSFELTAKVQNTNSHAGNHRDLCFFWGFQDPAHFYYVHLGAKPDPHSSQIFIVNGAPRRMITENESPGIPWTDRWHDVKVVYERKSGSMQVFFDDFRVPVLVAQDTTFDWGRVGVGTFDDHGNFDNIELRGEAILPIPVSAKLP